jgi:signal transduction histidine kinase
MAAERIFSRFLGKLEKDPVEVRRVFLNSIASTAPCKDVALILSGERKLLRGKKQSFQDLEEAIVRSDNSKKAKSHFRNLWIFRLSWRRQNVGRLILQKSGNKSPWPRIELLCKVYAFWESSHNLRSILQTLSAESAAVAKDYVRFTEQMKANQTRLQSISKGILRTQEEERAKISRDLHDGIGQELTAIKMNLDLLASAIKPHLSSEDTERWSETHSIAEQTLQDVRELSRLLRPRMLDDLGLFPTLRWYVRNFTKRVNIPVELLLEGEEKMLNPEIQTILFRVTQEGLNNAAKYSKATSVQVHLQCKEGGVRLGIQDNGIGFVQGQNSLESGSGISGMRDRVALYKGTFHVQSAPSKGTKLEIVLPLI